MPDSVDILNEYIDEWDSEDGQANIIPLLTKMAELIEKEYEIYLKTDPDPFDDRHPCRSKPNCLFGTMLKNMFRNDDLMRALINDYLMFDNTEELHIITCRLLLDILPGLEISVVFSSSQPLIDKLFSWALNDHEPLQSYATGLLAAAMELQDVATENKSKNAELVPVMLKKLQRLVNEKRNSASSSSSSSSSDNKVVVNHEQNGLENYQSATKRRRISSPSNDCSNSSWAEIETFLIGSSKIYPLTNEISQRFIYQYLTQMGEYHELLSLVFEYNVLGMILETIDLDRNPDVRLAFESLRYLSSLICHKKFALEFVNNNGIPALLKVYKQSLAASGVSLCFSCLAYHEDVMEKIIYTMPAKILDDLISYELYLIERSHDSSRMNAMLFFGLAFDFKVIIDCFDKQDGLRLILNEISMIDFLSNTDFHNNDDEYFAMRQYAKYICFALKHYFETHLLCKAVELIETSPEHEQFARLRNVNPSPFKVTNIEYDLFIEFVEAMLHLLPFRQNWEPVDKFLVLGGDKLMIKYIRKIAFGYNFTGKADAIRSALDVLVVCSVMPKFQLRLTEKIEIDDGDPPTVGIRMILAAATGDLTHDPQSQCSALQAIANCVCGPLNCSNCSRSTVITAGKKKSSQKWEDHLKKMWNFVRFENGIMRLIKLMMTKTPITEADAIRALSCKALCGLARSESSSEILRKLPLFANGQIYALMKEPILQDLRKEHLKFCKYCLELIELVTGTPVQHSSLETSVGNLNKAEVIAQTKIVYKERELLKLIHKHLLQKGFTKTANILSDEADLFRDSSVISNQIKIGMKTPTSPQASINLRSRQISLANTPTSTPTSQSTSSLSSNKSSSTIPTNTIKINRVQKNRSNNANIMANSAAQQLMVNSRRHSFHYNSPIAKRKLETSLVNHHHQSNPTVSLDSIITEYLRKQHALCKNPVVTCPPFDLFKPHRCPEPKNRNAAPYNVASRLIRRQYFPPDGGRGGSKLDRKYIYSRFRPCRVLRMIGEPTFLSCAFSYKSDQIYVGSNSGDLTFFNYLTGEFLTQIQFGRNQITHLEPSWDDRFMLTSQLWNEPSSVYWKVVNNNLEEIMSFPDDSYVEFGKSAQDKVLGTKVFDANLYDLNTLKLVRNFSDENFSNKYKKNRATFHRDDSLILNDGVLWDVRISQPLHKFDKFNDKINGVFHPFGLEIVSSSEIWDIRTYKLLKTVPALSESHIKFNGQGDVIYALYEKKDESTECESFGTSFRTFDGHDYSSIAIIDVKREISALALCKNDKYIAMIESFRENAPYVNQESVIRIYEVGRPREEDDEGSVDDDEDDDDEEIDDDDDDDDDEDEDDEDEETDEEVTDEEEDSNTNDGDRQGDMDESFEYESDSSGSSYLSPLFQNRFDDSGSGSEHTE